MTKLDPSLTLIRENMKGRDLTMIVVRILSESNKLPNPQHTVQDVPLTASRIQDTHSYWSRLLATCPPNSWTSGLARKKLIESEDLLVDIVRTGEVTQFTGITALPFDIQNYRRTG